MVSTLKWSSATLGDFERVVDCLIQYYTVDNISITWSINDKVWDMVVTFN